MATKAELEAQLAELQAQSGEAKDASPSKVTLPGFTRIPDTSHAIGVDSTFKTHVAIVRLNADGGVKMSKKSPGQPYKPLRIPVAVAEFIASNPDTLGELAKSCRENASE